MRCVLVGAENLLIECGELLRSREHEIVAVVAGSAVVASWADDRGIRTFDSSSPSTEWVHELRSQDFDWLFAITHLALLPGDVLGLPAQGSVNFHDGPLPRYAGLNCPAWAIMRGEQEYGITWHLITAGVDEGDVVKQRHFPLSPAETSLSLNTRNFGAAIDSFAEVLDDIERGAVSAVAQDPAQPRAIFRRSDRPAAAGALMWDRPAVELDRLVRALHFGPYANPLGFATLWTEHSAVRVAVAEAVEGECGPPGQIIGLSDHRLTVACATGGLSITEFVSSTGVPMSVASVADSHGLRAGQVLPVLSTNRRHDLDVLASRFARNEAFHVSRSMDRVAIPVPWARHRPEGHRPARERRTLSLASFSSAPLEDVASAALAIVLARVSAITDVHLSLFDDGIYGSVDHPDRELVAPDVTLMAHLDQGQSLGSVVDDIGRDIQELRQRGPAAADLLARFPDLRARSEAAGRGVLPVAIRIGPHPTAVDAVVLELHVEGHGCSLIHDSTLISDADAETIASCIETVAGCIATAPERSIRDVELLDNEVRRAVLFGWNDTDADASGGETIQLLFEQQVDRTPHAVAVSDGAQSLTFRRLDERANQLADHLRALGVGVEQMVGIHLGRSVDLVVAVLGVLKAGGAYLPLDPAYPEERLGYMVADSGCRVIISDHDGEGWLQRSSIPRAHVVDLESDRGTIGSRTSDRWDAGVDDSALAYCIYTSGSTGPPKGVLVEHRNVTNFFSGMDAVIERDERIVWLAVTSLSFDISVLELLYTLTRGAHVVIADDWSGAASPASASVPQRRVDFSLFYFSGHGAEDAARDKYRLLLEGAKWADTHGFRAVWTPERHFHAFGGLYPDPAVTGAAIAAVTDRVEIRAGSVVVPLHHPIRVAEAWSVVDNISNGRVAISAASGWQPEDFVLMPANHASAKATMFRDLEIIKRLWRGEQVTFAGVDGRDVGVRTLPRPVQPELPVWVTTAGNPETFVEAGQAGANVLTHLLGQSIAQLAPKIAAYRDARLAAGLEPGSGVVSLMLHTYVGADEATVRDAVRGPMKAYLGESLSLLKEYAGSFPAFKRPENAGDEWGDGAFADLTDDERDSVLEFAFDRYYTTSGLFGTPASCAPVVESLRSIGVDEIACLIDFGVPTDEVLANLARLDELRIATNTPPRAARERVDDGNDGRSGLDRFGEQVRRWGVTHLQCTPSLAQILSQDDGSRDALAGIEQVFIGGEAFPVALARALRSRSRSGRVTNMYGPTETTIWSTTWVLDGPLETVPIGSPIANTQVYVLDEERRPLPPGVIGRLWIGGRGVVRGYHGRPELTAERFVPDPFRGGSARMYDTGDRVRWHRGEDGSPLLEYHGRLDHQVKVRGHRIELGEIETCVGTLAGVRECVAELVTVPGSDGASDDQRLVAWVVTETGRFDVAAARESLREELPAVMIPATFVVVGNLPRTPNGKIDRAHLPAIDVVASQESSSAPATPPAGELERVVLELWEEVLGSKGFGVDDNFFDVGGHSLLVVRLHRRLADVIADKVELTDVYRYPTVRLFAAAFSDDRPERSSGAKVGLARAARRRGGHVRRVGA